jgi:four helix bundle protein
MQHTTAVSGPDGPLAVPPAVLDAERLEVFHVAVAFQAASARLLPVGHAVLRDQLERASVSVVLNISGGCRARFMDREGALLRHNARGSATESAAVLDLLRARGLVSGLDYRRGRALLVRVIQMLTRLSRPER